MSVRTIATLTLGFLTATVILPAREIGFVEKFSLAEDRSKALDELVAGTQEYYYYSALHALTGKISRKLTTSSSFGSRDMAAIHGARKSRTAWPCSVTDRIRRAR